MSYQVIARKWRPQIFDELIGQEHISQTLLNTLRNHRVPHALLFTGPRGTGKTSSARIFAKSLRCPNAKDFVPCNSCPQCDDISVSRSMDVMEIDGASNNGVDAIRELRETVGFMPSSGKFKIYIIDEVHMLSGSAFNALLKTLEEPPAHVVFVLATTEAQKIPNTVLSRCQRYDFRKISTRLISEHLKKICLKEDVKTESEALWAIARQGDGSMRDSQSLLDQVISFCDGHLTLQKVIDVLGLTDRGILTDTLSALVNRDKKSIAQVIEKIMVAGYDPIVFMKDLMEDLRHLTLIKVTGDKAESVVDLPNEEISRLKELGKNLSEEDLHLLFDMSLKGAQDLHRAQDTRVVLEMVLLRMAIAPRIQNLMALSPASRTAATQTSPVSTEVALKTAALAQESAPQVPAPPVSLPVANDSQSLNERWTEFADRVRKVNGLMAAQLDQLHLISMENKSVVIGVPEKYKFLAPQVSDGQFQKKIINYLNTFWGPGHLLEIKSFDAKNSTSLNPVAVQDKKRQEAKDSLTQKVEEHPLVRQAKSILNTQIKSIREN